jgi:hypothetical protein
MLGFAQLLPNVTELQRADWHRHARRLQVDRDSRRPAAIAGLRPIMLRPFSEQNTIGLDNKACRDARQYFWGPDVILVLDCSGSPPLHLRNLE